jgi:hypothetical protein
MTPDSIVTVGLAGLVIVCVGGGIGVVIWLYSKFAEIKDELIAAIAQSRTDGDTQIKSLGVKIEKLTDSHHKHELHVAETYLSKESAASFFGRMEKSLDELRSDIKSLLGR